MNNHFESLFWKQYVDSLSCSSAPFPVFPSLPRVFPLPLTTLLVILSSSSTFHWAMGQKKEKCLQWVTFPEKSRSVVDPRRSRCPIGLRFQEASNLLAWHELFANLYELTSRILVLGGIKPLWANIKGIWIWPIFVKFRQNILGIMTNESVSKNFDIWNTQHDSHIFSYINFRCRYLDNQSKHRKKLGTLLLIDALWMRLCSQFARAAASDTR